MKRKLKNQMLLGGQKGVDSEAELETLIFKKKNPEIKWKELLNFG